MLSLKIKPELWHTGYAELLEILDLPNMTWQADPRGGRINIDTGKTPLSTEAEQKLMWWKLKYS